MKQMTGTDGLLAWPKTKRKCSLENDEKCRMKGFMTMVNQCDCLPFELVPAASGLSKQVRVIDSPQMRRFSCPQLCSPGGLDCFKNVTNPSCGLACQGLYADVYKEIG